MGRPRVLLVEDDILIAWTISSVLKQLGCTVVDYADTADQAVERAIAVRPDVILMDIGLAGGRDGIAAAAEIRASTGPVGDLSHRTRRCRDAATRRRNRAAVVRVSSRSTRRRSAPRSTAR
ncbi:MAG: response regulator [Pseudomonadota bacterium]